LVLEIIHALEVGGRLEQFRHRAGLDPPKQLRLPLHDLVIAHNRVVLHGLPSPELALDVRVLLALRDPLIKRLAEDEGVRRWDRRTFPLPLMYPIGCLCIGISRRFLVLSLN